MQMKKRALALVTAVILVLMLVPGVSFAAEMSEAMQAAYDALVIPNADDVRGNITLPEVGENGAAISWTSSDEAVVSTEETENEGYLPTPAGVVTRGAEDTDVTLTATITIGDETAEKVFNLTVKAAPDSGVSLMDAGEDDGGYLFYYFRDNSFDGQQIYLAASKDGLKWTGINENAPILRSELGDMAVRDPYIFRSHEGDKFYLIATDLDASAGSWSDYSSNGSKDIMIWESTDLINWSEQRKVTVSTLPEMGCTWAPEATYDDTTGNYVVYWAAKNIDSSSDRNNLQTVYYATTRDFYTFSEPQVFITHNSANPDTPIAVIDTTIYQDDDGLFYRITKHEGESRVFLEVSDYLLGDYTSVSTSNLYNDFGGVEGPEIYRLEDGRYCVILDNFGGGGYFPVVTSDLSEGVFTRLDGSEYSFAGSPRHGGVIKVTAEEYEAVLKSYGDLADTVTPDADGSDPILAYDFNNGTAEDRIGENDGTLHGNAAVTEDIQKGSVLSLDGSADTYLEIPQGLLDGRNQLTVSMDVRNTTTGNFFTFALGRNDSRYIYARLRPDSVRAAITLNSYGVEEAAELSGLDCGDKWVNLTVTLSDADNMMKVYLDGELRAETELTLTVAELGTDTLAYVGRSFFSADAYANMKVDDVEIYNRALSADEIAEKYSIPDEERQRYSMVIDADEQGAEITDGMFGLFFEDINYAGDGGMYSEVINNRSFEAYSKTDDALIPGYGWSAVGGAALSYNSENPLNENNTTYLTLTAAAAGDGVKNDCYSGFSAREGEKYNASVYVRGDYDGMITMQVLDNDGTVIGEGSIGGVSADFIKREFEIELTGSCTTATVQVVLSESGTVELDMISLIPQQTFNGRDNGLRADLVEMLAELNPGFLRFPGGCIIEGYDLSNRYQWKHSVGPVEQRVQNWNRWQTHTSGDGRYGYCQTYGLGFYEYLLLCEDIGADAVPVFSVGIGCQYQTGDYSTKEELYSIYIQDVLDFIEFANGTPDSDWAEIDYSSVNTMNPETFNNNWANLRALMGHPESFEVSYIGVGNEQWDTSDYSEGRVDEDGWADNGNNFFRRYEAFEEAIHELYPDMKLIGTSGPNSGGDDFNKAWSWLRTHNGEEGFTYAVDEHYYRTPEWFYNNINRYDAYDRSGFSVFAGEYASRWTNTTGNTLETALSEAAYMTRLEKNSDIVKMASYAPLFAKEGSVQWAPDLIWFNTDTVYGSPDYYVQKLYSNNSGDYNLESEVVDKYDDRDFTGTAGVGTWLTSANFSDFKVVDNDTGEDITPAGWVLQDDPEKYTYTVTASSEPEASAGNVKENIMDGDLSTRWTAEGTDEWLLCDLGEVKTVGRVGVATNPASGREYYYAIQLSEDGEEYTTLYDGTNGDNNGSIVYTLAGNTEARYVRILAKGNSYHEWNAVTEVEIYGECEQTENAFAPTGSWSIDENGIASQTDEAYTGAYLFADEPITAENYTITVKATKISGREGFIIPVMATDGNNLIHWNIGGWGNTLSAFETRTDGTNSGALEGGMSSVMSLETGREYELEIVVQDGTVYGYIDGELISAYTFEKTLGPVYGNAVFDEETGDIIVKLVNSSGNEQPVPVQISYSGSLTGEATQYLLTGDSLEDKNSADDPENVGVTVSEIDGVSNDFVYDLPAYSFVVLRVHTGDAKAVTSMEEIAVSSDKGETPVLPGAVEVTLSDGTTEDRAVTWRLPTAGTFVNPGVFTVYGDIAGSEVTAEATVTVVNTDENTGEAISVNTDALLNGAKTAIYFNPNAEGEYMGVMAVYSDGELESSRIIKFSAESYSELVQLHNAEGKEIKFMLWTEDGLVPLTEAVTVE